MKVVKNNTLSVEKMHSMYQDNLVDIIKIKHDLESIHKDVDDFIDFVRTYVIAHQTKIGLLNEEIKSLKEENESLTEKDQLTKAIAATVDKFFTETNYDTSVFRKKERKDFTLEQQTIAQTFNKEFEKSGTFRGEPISLKRDLYDNLREELDGDWSNTTLNNLITNRITYLEREKDTLKANKVLEVPNNAPATLFNKKRGLFDAK